MRINSKLLVAVGLLTVFLACDKDSPTGPTPPPSCSFTLSVTTLSFPAQGGSTTVGVTTTSQCAWTAASDREWLSITAGASGTGTGSVNVTVTTNPGLTVRTGSLTIAGQTVAVLEEAQPACSVTLSPASASYSESPAAGTVSVTSPSYCQWTAVSTAPWLTVTAGSPGQGNGTVSYGVDRNRETAARSAALVINEKTFGVTQAAEPIACEYSVTPVEFTPCMSVPFAMTAMVTTQATCAWTATAGASWISITEGQSGSGSGPVSFVVTVNWDAPRTGVVEVRWPTVTAGQNLQVAQAGCYYFVSTSTVNVGAGAGSAKFDVLQQSDPTICGGPTQNACQWTAVSHAPWLTITTTMPQVGDNPVQFEVTPNNTGAARTTTITVRDKTVTIIQAGS